MNKARTPSICNAIVIAVLGCLGVAVRLFAQAPGAGASSDASQDKPLSAAHALAAFRLEPGLRIELAAAEPLIESPVAVTFDERGRMYVAENRGYPTGPAHAGRIARLEDTDGDGTFDKRTGFADGLSFPNGLMPWRDGLIVTCAPDILYLRDTDGDGRADRRRVLFTGFSTSNSAQLRTSHPTLGIDNWIYTTGGLSGGTITSPDLPGHAVVESNRADFRFRPEGATSSRPMAALSSAFRSTILVAASLIPEREITPGFAAYVLETTDGRILTGLLTSETETRVTLRQALGKEETVLRSDIASLALSKLSLMPQELEKTMSQQDLADLLAYL